MTLTRDYFLRKQGVFRNLRPLYEHSRHEWYLQYTADGLGVVTERYSPSNSNDNVLMKTKDFALRPEYISKTWSVHYNGWRYMPKLRVLCRGVNSMSNTVYQSHVIAKPHASTLPVTKHFVSVLPVTLA